MTAEKLVAGPLRGAIEQLCPSCQAADNNPYTDANGVAMRACMRCMIQWRDPALASLPSSPPPPKWGAEIAARAEFGELEDYPGQAYVHAHNPNIKRAEENAIAAGQRAEGAEARLPQLSGESAREFIVNEVTQQLGRIAKTLNGGEYEKLITHSIMPIATRAAIRAYEAALASPPVAEKTELGQAGRGEPK